MSQAIIPVFSGGVGRSGTTIVSQILRKHPDLIAGKPNEIRFLTESYGLLDLVYGMQRLPSSQLTRAERIALLNPLNKSVQYRFRFFRKKMAENWWKRVNRIGEVSGVHRAMNWNQMSKLLDDLGAQLDNPIEAGRDFMFGYIRAQRRYSGHKFWMDTTPPNMMQADLIYRLLPEARFIEMRRHPLDNIASVLREPWGPNDLKSALPWFKDRIELASAAKKVIPEAQHLTLWLEDLVERDREKSYRNLISVAGVTDHPAMSEFFATKVLAKDAHFGRWRTGFDDPESAKRSYEQAIGPVD